jgi:VanZ family protein
LILLAYTIAWTTALVVPVPNAEELPFGEELFTHRVLFAKSVHVSAYALFAILVGWLQWPQCWRPLLMCGLMLHGAGSEWIQENLTSTRSGSLSDVLFDHLGILVGLCISWKWWTRTDPPLAA